MSYPYEAMEAWRQAFMRQLHLTNLHSQIHQKGEGCCCLTGAPCPCCPTHQQPKVVA